MRTKSLNNFLLGTAAFTTLWGGLTFSAAAQEDPADVERVSETTEDETRTEEKIVVTGSRLANEYTSIAPLDIISADSAVLEGIADVGTLLQTATVAAGSPQVTAATSAAFVQNGGIGTETISLRGLGANRTLVLLNGRRAGPAGTRGGVSSFDLNAIPLSAVQNIEVLKDGASSIYGSDAVAGVVNIITRTEDGADIDFFYNQPEEQGGEELRASATYGTSFNKGRILVSLDYFKQEELAQGDRDYFSCGEDYVFNEDGSRADLIDPRTGNFACSDLAWGHVWMYNYLDPGLVGRPWQSRPQMLQYDYDGSLAANGLAPFGSNGFGLNPAPGWYPVGLGELALPGAVYDPEYSPTALLSEALMNADHPFQDQQSLIPEVERMTFYANGEYDLTDDMQVYGDFLLNRRETRVNGYRQFWQYDYLYNYFGYVYTNAPGLAANGFTADPTSFSFIGLSPTAITDHADDKVTVDYVNAVVGLRGSFDAALSDWNYDAFFQFSRSDGEYEGDVIYDDAITPYQWFNTGSCAFDADGVTDVRGVPCITPDWYNPEFLAGNISEEDRAFLFGTEVGKTIYEQSQFELFVDGPLFELPAGDLIAGFGFNRVSERLKDTPAETFQIGNAWGSSSAGITEGSKTTTAVFGEVAIPIVKDKPFFEAVDLSLSARWTDVDVYGSDTTFKAGLGWQITPSLRARTTYGTSFRAPALFELFLDEQTSFLGQRSVDPCINWGAELAAGNISQRRADNCAADGVPGNHGGSGSSATIIASGNAGSLEAETSDAFNIGLVWAPEWLDFRASIDYFEIEIEDQINQLGAGNILLGCYESDNFGTEPLCDLFGRNPTSFLITDVTNNFINVAEQTNKGIDVQAEYTRDFSFGSFVFTTQHTFQLEDEILLFPNSAPIDTNGEAGDPEWVGEFNVNFERGLWNVYYGIDFVGKTSNIDSFGGNTGTYFGMPVTYKLKTEDTFYHSMSVAREFPYDVTVRVGVSNLFNEEPPAVTTLGLGEYSTVGTSAFYSQYDWLGRSFFVNVNKAF